jgi:hypothetical protein
VTENMSGRCLCIDRQANGQLVVFHANSPLGSNRGAKTTLLHVEKLFP